MTTTTTEARGPSGSDYELAARIYQVLDDYHELGSLQIARVITGSTNMDLLRKTRSHMYRVNKLVRKIAREQNAAIQIDRDAGSYILTREDTLQGEKEAVRGLKSAQTQLQSVDDSLIGTTPAARAMKATAVAADGVLNMISEVAETVRAAATAEAKARRTGN